MPSQILNLNDYKYLSPIDISPKIGLQIKADFYEGMCSIYSLIYLQLRLMNPDIDQKVIINYLKSKEKNNILDIILKYTRYVEKILKENEDFDKMVSSMMKEEAKNKNPLSKTPFVDVPQKLKTPKNDYIVLDNIVIDDENLNNLQTGKKERKKKSPLSKTPFYDVPQRLAPPTNDYILLDNIYKDENNLNNLEDY